MSAKDPFADVPERRRRLMARIRSRDTAPELVVRRLCHSLGFRYRLHRRDLPGTPDLVFPGRRKAIFVHGCFWHRHEGCRRTTTPKTRTEFWTAKFQANVDRDRRVRSALDELGWEVMIAWECETRSPEVLAQDLCSFLGGTSAGSSALSIR